MVSKLCRLIRVDGERALCVYDWSHCLTIVSSSVIDQCTSALADTEANANLSCLETMIGTTVYYQGNDPLGFLEALRAAISARGNFGIDGLLGILGPQVTLVGTDDGTGTGTDGDGTGTGTNGDGTGTGTNGDGTGTGTNGDGTGTGTTGDGTGTTGDGTGNTGDGTGTGANGNDNVVAGAEAPEDPSINRGNDGVSVGTTVGVTAAGLALALLVLLLAGRRRRHAKEEKVEEGASMHRQFTDEEDDDDSYTRDMDAGAYDKNIAHVVSDEDDSVVIRWGETGDQPIYSEPIESILAADDMKFAMENHSCSSPSCKICAKKAEEGVGVRFIATPRSSNVPAPLSRDSRSYLSNDTVDL
jgi:MYXO-CTERM domain-containing protein